jgi:ribonuclease Z
MDVTLLGTGGPLPDPDRAGPATLVRTSDATLLVDAGRGVLMRLAAAGVGAGQVDAVLITHLHSDHITDLGDLITTRWITSFAPDPLRVFGPVGTTAHVDSLLGALGPDIGYRMAHHEDLSWTPPVEVHEITPGTDPLTGVWRSGTHDGATVVWAAPTDHRPVHPSLGYRVDHGGAAVVLAGDTVPCDGLDTLASGADVLVHTVIRKDLLAAVGIPRLTDVLDYHSSPAEAGATAERAGVKTLVLTHYVPAPAPGTLDEWKSQAAGAFNGGIFAGEDLVTVST